ncbi:hypothetical protein F4802DRAFT_562818 [Xylaria palmicola]|nr:hypothetical protein F4802DRAFT_562818 [Xylaria palmicola]
MSGFNARLTPTHPFLFLLCALGGGVPTLGHMDFLTLPGNRDAPWRPGIAMNGIQRSGPTERDHACCSHIHASSST